MRARDVSRPHQPVKRRPVEYKQPGQADDKADDTSDDKDTAKDQGKGGSSPVAS
jgi:hypothetical protein